MSTSEDQIPRHRWLAVAAAVNERMSEVGLDQADLAAESGLSAQVVRDLQRGVPKSYRSTTLVRVARALEWPVDAFPRLLSGVGPVGDPETEDRTTPAPPRSGIAAIQSQVAELESSLAVLRRQLDAVQRSA